MIDNGYGVEEFRSSTGQSPPAGVMWVQIPPGADPPFCPYTLPRRKTDLCHSPCIMGNRNRKCRGMLCGT